MAINIGYLTANKTSAGDEVYTPCLLYTSCPFFENDSLKTIRNALNELYNAGYLRRSGKTYMVNKVRITQMKLA